MNKKPPKTWEEQVKRGRIQMSHKKSNGKNVPIRPIT